MTFNLVYINDKGIEEGYELNLNKTLDELLNEVENYNSLLIGRYCFQCNQIKSITVEGGDK